MVFGCQKRKLRTSLTLFCHSERSEQSLPQPPTDSEDNALHKSERKADPSPQAQDDNAVVVWGFLYFRPYMADHLSIS